jgi:hypothetical protein
MGRRLFTTYKKRRNNYVEQYRQWEASQDEMTGVITTYVAVAEGTQNDALRRIARARLRKVLTYLSDSAYLMVLPRGGVAARGPGDALPALEWPFANAIARAVGDAEPSWSAVSFEGGLQRAGLWKLFEGPTDRAMALAWTTAVVLPDPLPNPAGAGPLVREVAAALAAWSTTSWTPKFLTPGHVGFVAGIYLARDGFDCGNTNNDDASSGMAIAALMHSWPPETRFRNYIDYVANYTGDWSPFSTGFVPFLGFLAAGGTDSTTRVAYDFWLRKRRQRGVDTDPVIGWSSTCFASAVALLVNQGADPAEEQKFIELLDTQYERVSYWPGRSSGEELPILEYHDTWAALDYLSSLALAWRYRRDRESAGGTLPIEFPSPPPSDVIWPEPAVPRSAIESPDLNGYIPIAAIQGIVPPAYDGQEARLFAASSPTRPPAPRPNLTFGDEEFTSTETFQVGPGPEVFTGVALQWGDVWEITATGEVTIGGTTFAPEGGSEPVYDARYPVHFGRDSGATNGCLVARLNNYVVIKKRRRPERWLFPEETFIYLSLNQSTGVLTNGTGTFEVTVTLRGPKRDLSTVREISCVTRDKSDPDRRIDGVGGVGRSGLRWWLSLEDARLQIEQGVRFIVRQKDVRPALVDIRKRQGTLYLATQPDPPPARRRVPLPVELRNNLSWKAMPECPFNG